VNNNTRENPRIRKEQEQEHKNQGARYSPDGGEQKETARSIDGGRKLIVVLVKHRDEPC
jgi:hypothetical protein